MKISAFALFQLASIGSASAFVVDPASTQRACLPLRMSNNEQWNDGPAKPIPTRKSEAIPFMNSPKILDGTIAGDRGFDPLGFADSDARLTEFREAEIKHARLAMLAAAGWPLSELWDRKIASILDMPPILDATNRAPSVLNGGLGKINPAYWIGCIAIAAAVEGYGGMVQSKKEGYYPGDFGFDPFGLYPKDENGQARMRLSEIKHGRLAMVAITAFAAQEFVAGTAVVEHAAIFFKPITQVLADQSLAGLYVAPPIEEVQNAAVEALEAAQSVFPPVEAVPEAVTAVVPPVEAVSEAVTAVIPPVDAVSAASVEAAAVVPPVPAAPVAAAPSAELIAAKERIVELEAKLSKIAEFSR